MCDFPIERPTVGNIEMAYHNLYWAFKDSILEDDSVCPAKMQRAKVYAECLMDYIPKVVDDNATLSTLLSSADILIKSVEDGNWEGVIRWLYFLGDDLKSSLGIELKR